MLLPESTREHKDTGRPKNLRRPTARLEKEDVHRVWNFIIPEHKERKYNPIQAIPLLTKQRFSVSNRKLKQRN